MFIDLSINAYIKTPPSICGPLIVRAPPARFSAINNHARLSPSFITKPQTRPHNGSLHSFSPASRTHALTRTTGQPRVHRLRLPNSRRRKGRRPRHPLRPATRCRRRQARRRQGRYQARASRGALHGQRRPGWCRAVSRQAGRYRCRVRLGKKKGKKKELLTRDAKR